MRTENKQGHGCCGFGGIFLPSHLPLGPAAPVPPPLDIAEVEIGLLYPPVGGDLLWFVALHVLLHGGKAGAVLQADGALVGGSAIVGPKVFDHGRVVPGALVAQLALKRLLACGRRGYRGVSGGSGPPGANQLPGIDAATAGTADNQVMNSRTDVTIDPLFTIVTCRRIRVFVIPGCRPGPCASISAGGPVWHCQPHHRHPSMYLCGPGSGSPAGA